MLAKAESVSGIKNSVPALLLQSMIELSRTQDEEVGDGTTSVIILGELKIHPVIILLSQQLS